MDANPMSSIDCVSSGRGGEPVERIVLISSNPEPDYVLLAWLKTLFPDCEIHIDFRKAEAFEECP